MKSKVLKVLAWTCAANLLHCSIAHADLGNCFVFRGGDSHLDGDVYDESSKSIYEAYAASSNSDGDFIFLLDVTESSRPKGSYAIQRIRLIVGDSWALKGYKISAPDVDGIRNGTAEVVHAFRSGDIYRLESGDRDEAVPAPRTDNVSPNKTLDRSVRSGGNRGER